MTPEAIVSLTAAVSIAFSYMEPEHPDLRQGQTLQEERITQFDAVISACKAILQQFGRPKYLHSIWLLWMQFSQSLFMLEKILWPEQPPDTPLPSLSLQN